MFNNQLHIGTLFGMILLAPTVMFGIGIVNDYQPNNESDEFYFMLIVWLALMIASFGLLAKQIWAIQMTSIIIIITTLLALWGITMDNGVFDEPFTFIGLIIGFGVFCFGTIALLNNDLVLQQFGAKEEYNDLDDILDDI